MKKCLILTIIATLVSLFFPSNANALGRRGGSRSCGFVSSCSTCFAPSVQTVVEVPIPVLAYPVLVPAFQFQYVPQTYAPTVPVVPVTGYPIATPVVQPVGIGYGVPPGYGSYGQPVSYGQPPAYGYTQPQYQQPPAQQNFSLNNKDKIRELAKALLEEMNRQAENGGDDGPPMVPGTRPPVQQQQQSFGQQQQPNSTQVSLGAMQRTCAQCHTGVGSKADMILFTQPGYVNQHANWKKIKDEVVSGRMPPRDSGFQLAPQERSMIIQWLSSIGVN